MTDSKNPKLRFKDEKGKDFPDWGYSKLGDISNFKKGKGISKDDTKLNGKNKCIRYGELFTEYQEVINKIKSFTDVETNGMIISKKNDVLMPTSDVTPRGLATATAINETGVILGGDILIINSEKLNNIFLAYYIRNHKKDIMRLVTGVTVYHIYSSDLSNLFINYPQYPEQVKIVEFLTTVDNYIQNLKSQKEELEKYKKAVMQKIFSQQLRFKDSNGNNFPNWDNKKIGEIAKIQGGYAFKSQFFRKEGIPIIRISNISLLNNFVNNIDLVFYKRIDNEENFILKTGDILIALSGATTGKIGVYIGEKAYLNQRVAKFINRDSDILDYSFLTQFVFTDFFSMQIKNVLVAGAQPNLSPKEIEKFNIFIPSLKEQRKISSFLTNVDNLITIKSKEIENAESWKKGLMQQLFV